MKKVLLFILISGFQLCSSFGQLVHPVVGTYKKKTAQGMAIHNDIAYLFSDGGRCRIFDLKRSKICGEFSLCSSSPTNHVNNACFGKEIGLNNIPLIYITECKNKFRCFVEEILPDTARLIQTISATMGGKLERVLVWVVDKERGLIYTITRTDKTLKSEGYSLNTLTEYKLPYISDGENIVLTEKEILGRYVLHFSSILQGAKIKNGTLFIVTGLQQSQAGRLDAQRAIQVVDLKKKILKKTIDLSYITTNEPEDLDFYKGEAMLYCGQEGGIYEIKLK